MELKIHHYTIFTGSGPCDYALTTVIAENCDDAEHLLEASYKPENMVGRATEEEKEKGVCEYRVEVQIPHGNFVETIIAAQNEEKARELLKILYGERCFRNVRGAAGRLRLRLFKAKIKFDDGREVWTAIRSNSLSNAQMLLKTLYHADVVCI